MIATTTYALVKLGVNRLLDALPESERRLLLPELQPMQTPVQMDIYAQDGLIEYVYFPLHGIVSYTTQLSDGTLVEVGMTGAEGFLGYPVLLGSRRSHQRVFMQVSGDVLRMRTRQFLKLAAKLPRFHQLLLRFSQSMFSQACQIAACNRMHEAEERLCRWLLTVQDRLASDELPLTQEFLGMMLGTRRSTVTIAAGVLQRAGAIEYSRGHIHVVNRETLENAACECHQRSRNFLEQVFEN
jgi:CRP-like cAMP-binding protein